MTTTSLPRKSLPLSLQMILLSIVAGCLVFFLTDLILGIQVERSFQEQLVKKLRDQAIEGRARFDHYVKSHYQLTQLIVSQQSFQDYINKLPQNQTHSKLNKRAPVWLPKRSILRSLAPSYYYLLFDKNRKLIESYQSGLDPLPEQLRHPDYNLFTASHNENFIASINGVPFIISSETKQSNNGKNTVTVLLASPIDDSMLLSLMPPYTTRQTVVMSTGFDPYVVSSSDGELIPKGKKISDLKEEYLIFGEKVFNYEYTDLLVTYNHLMPISAVKELARPIMKRQRFQLALIAMAFIFSFSLIIIFISRRIQSLTEDVVSFSHTFIGKESDEYARGDEITTLKQQFDFLSKEVLASTREQTSLLQSVLKAIPTPIFYENNEGQYIGCNKAFERLLHLTKKEIIGKNVFDILPKDQAEIFNKADQQLFAEGGTQVSQSAFPDKNGITSEVVFHRAIFKKGDGSPGGLVGAIMDITNIQKVKDDLSYANALLKGLLDSIPDLVFHKDTDGIYLGCNRAFSEFIDRPEKDVVGHTDFDFFPEDMATFFRKHDSKMLAMESPQHNEEWVNYPNGRKVLLDTLKTPLYDLDGNTRGLIGISRDITERYQAEEQRKADYERFKTVLDSFDSLIYVADMDSYELLFINEYGRKIWGDIKGKTCWQTEAAHEKRPI